MKVVLAPSKTMQLSGVGETKPFNLGITKVLVEHMQDISEEDLRQSLKIKEDKAKEVKKLYLNFANAQTAMAAEAFTGLAFKNLDWKSLSAKAKAFGKENLLIFSGLYGILRPCDIVKLYRLDFENRVFKNITAEKEAEFIKISGTNLNKLTLSNLWKSSINEFLQNEDFIINLASKEYSVVIDHPLVYTVIFEEFRNGKWKQLSTMSKQMRGKLARCILQNEMSAIDELPEVFEGFEKLVENRIIKYRKFE